MAMEKKRRGAKREDKQHSMGGCLPVWLVLETYQLETSFKVFVAPPGSL
jgi:hypothetical protein